MEKASIINFFSLLEIKESFFIDENEVEKKYLKLQQKFNKLSYDLSKSEQEVLNEKISLVNFAYSCIKNPMNRAEHLLKLNGCTDAEIPNDNLIEIMDLEENSNREKILNLHDEYSSNMKQEFKKNNYKNAQLNFLLLKYINRLIEKNEN